MARSLRQIDHDSRRLAADRAIPGSMARVTLAALIVCAELSVTLLATPVSAQVVDLRPVRTLVNGDSPPLGVSFGQSLAASGPYLLVSGTDVLGDVDLRGWVQLGDLPWTPFLVSAWANDFSGVAPVALGRQIAYRVRDEEAGFELQRLDLEQVGSGGTWSDVWGPDDPTAAVRSLDVVPPQGGADRVVAVGWQSLSRSHFRVLVDRVTGVDELYSDFVTGGGAPSVSVDSGLAVVGLPGLGEVVTLESGFPWIELSTFVGPVGALGFGTAVAVRGDTLAVSAPEADVCILPPNGCVQSGQVWIYTLIGSTWTFATPLFSAFDVEGGEQLGRSLRFTEDGNRLAVGAPGASTTFLFSRDGSGSWSQSARAQSSPPQSDGAGTAGAFAGNGDLVVGAPVWSGGSGPVGAALVFRELVFRDGYESGDGGAWSQTIP